MHNFCCIFKNLEKVEVYCYKFLLIICYWKISGLEILIFLFESNCLILSRMILLRKLLVY